MHKENHFYMNLYGWIVGIATIRIIIRYWYCFANRTAVVWSVFNLYIVTHSTPSWTEKKYTEENGVGGWKKNMMKKNLTEDDEKEEVVVPYATFIYEWNCK